MLLSDKIQSCFSLSQLDLLRGEILQDKESFKENQKLFVSQQNKIKRGGVKSSLVVTDILFTSFSRTKYRTNQGTGKRMNLGSEEVRCKEINFLGVYWSTEGKTLDFSDKDLYEDKSWTTNNCAQRFTRYTLLTPSAECWGVNWLEHFLERFRKEYRLFDCGKKWYLFRKDVDVRKVAIKGTRIKWNKDFNYVISLNKADFIYLQNNGVPMEDIFGEVTTNSF